MADPEPAKQEVNSTVILPPLVFPVCTFELEKYFDKINLFNLVFFLRFTFSLSLSLSISLCVCV